MRPDLPAIYADLQPINVSINDVGLLAPKPSQPQLPSNLLHEQSHAGKPIMGEVAAELLYNMAPLALSGAGGLEIGSCTPLLAELRVRVFSLPG
jgi:hypothetical protein